MKKFLSLVLALIMTMSLVTIGAGATEYRDLTDKDEIQYEEAVAVLNRIGVITGYEDGSFRPETELTRGAAAKIIVSLLIGPEAAANLPNATAPYPDVPASHTFAGVISYCKTAGIISGYGDGTFKPANSLTGFAFAKMLLGALGYKSEIEGFVDTGWTMNVARIGNVTGLFDRLDFDGSAAVNREEACQLALNTLKATMVTYGGTTLVTGAQALAVQGTQAMYVTSNNREINANINRRVISAANNEMTLEFGEEHFKDLRLEHDKYDPAYDVYGHPSNEWSWKKVTIGTFKLPADFTYTKQMSHLEDTVATKEKALGLRNYDTWSIDHRAAVGNWSSPSSVAGLNGAGAWVSPFDDATQITINGWNARVNDKDEGRLVSYDASTFNNANKKPTGVPTIAEIADLTDNGVTVEVYVCPVDADFITNVVVTRTQLMKVKRIGSDFVTLEDIKPDSRSPRDKSDLKAITGYNAFAIDVTEKYDLHNSSLADVKDSNYDAYNALKDMKVGDYVAVVPYTTDEGVTWEVGEAYAPETVSGAFTKVDTYANVNKPKGSAVAITVGGTSYPINEWNKDLLNVTGAEIKATKKDVTLYLAKDGTVLWADEVGNSDAWMVVGDYYQAASAANKGKIGWFVHGWTIGGDEVDLDLGTIRGDAEKYAPGELVYYNIAEEGNGEYVLSKPSYSKKGSTSGWNHYKDGADAPDAVNKDGEGIYEVSQYTWDADNPNTKAKQYQINKRNGALALENYNTDTKDNPPVSYKIPDNTPTVETDDDVAPGLNAPVKHVNKTDKANTDGVAPGIIAHEFNYSNLLYDGVKFIFVSFDAANGEVETIDFKSGVQNVDYQDLVRFNKYWKNIGTNDGQKFVLSAAEAYVNDKGMVKAVVIKADSSEADLSKIAVITDTPGDKNWQKTGGAEGDRTDGMSYAKRYVTGPSFSMANEKTGYFDRDYAIGTILVITEKENYIVGKYFHSTYYNNGNPDAVFVKGISGLKNIKGDFSEAGFLIGQDGNTVWTLNKGNVLTYDGVTNPEVVPGEDRIVDLLGDKYVSGYDTYLQNGKDLKGLVKVDGNTTFVDLRAINTDTIDDLGDLLDYDLSTVELRLLVNGNDSTDTFRHAYAVVVEKAEGKKDVAKTPDVVISAMDNGVLVTGDDIAITATSPKTYTVKAPAGDTVVLNAGVDGTGYGTLSYTWKNAIGQTVTAPVSVVVPAAGEATFTVSVTNTDNSKKDVQIASSTVKVIVKAKDGEDPGPEDPTETYDLTLAGAAFGAGDIVTANGKTITTTDRVAPFVYKIPQNAEVKINFAAGGAVGSTNNNKTYTVNDVTISFKGATSNNTYEDNATIAKLTKDLVITMAANGEPTGSTQKYTIKSVGGVTGTWTKAGETDQTLSAGGTILVPAGGVLKITAKGDGAAVVANDGLAGNVAVRAGALASVAAAKTAVMGVNAEITVGDDIALFSATPITTTGTGAAVAATVDGVSFESAATDAYGIYMPVGQALAVSGGGFSGYIKTTDNTVVTADSSTASFTISDATPVFVKGAWKLTYGTGVVAKTANASGTTIDSGKLVDANQVVYVGTSSTEQVAVVDYATAPVGYGVQTALTGAPAALSAATNFEAYTKVTLSIDAGAKIEKNAASGVGLTQVALQRAGAVNGIKSGTAILVTGTNTNAENIVITEDTPRTNVTASKGTNPHAGDGGATLADVTTSVGDVAITFTQA